MLFRTPTYSQRVCKELETALHSKLSAEAELEDALHRAQNARDRVISLEQRVARLKALAEAMPKSGVDNA